MKEPKQNLQNKLYNDRLIILNNIKELDKKNYNFSYKPKVNKNYHINRNNINDLLELYDISSYISLFLFQIYIDNFYLLNILL